MTPASFRRAEILAVGSELLGATRLDTNSLYITDRLETLGVQVRAKAVVGDDRADLAALFAQALSRADLVVVSGGLGPTADDVTRETVAEVLGLPLEEDPTIAAAIAERFAKRQLRMPEVNRRQAMVPRGATVIDNPRGTAPGLLIEAGGRIVALLPGPPRELKPMVDALVEGAWQARAGAERIYKASLYVTGRGESHVEEVAQPIYSRWVIAEPPIDTTILASPGQTELHLSLRSADPAAGRRRVEAARDELAVALGADVFGTDGSPLEAIVGGLLRTRGLTVAAAESCSGGLFLSRLTDVPGSSEYVLGGVVVYSNASKTALAGVAPELIAAHGAVSEPVASAMAEGIRQRTGASLGVGISGIAGPGGGTPQKPVGTVAIALAGAPGQPRVRTFSFVGNRSMVKFQSAQAALDMLRRALS